MEGNTQNYLAENLIEARTYLFAREWSVFPVKFKSKDPEESDLFNRGYVKANENGSSTGSWKALQEKLPTEEDLAEWFGNGTLRNIGIVTGKVSGLIVLDVDPGGDATLKKFGDLPQTLTATTSRGKHYYFKHPGYDVPSHNRKDIGLDLRGEGGYVVAPPSMHIKGQYTWETDPFSVDIAEFPSWVLDIFKQGNTSTGGELADLPKYIWKNSLSDDELIAKAMAANGGEKFTNLRAGIQVGYDSQSEADQALCNLLAFWCGGDDERMDRLFRDSGLYRSDKWERKDYRQRTINFALAGRTDFYKDKHTICIDRATGKVVEYLTNEAIDDRGNAMSVAIRYAGNFAHNKAYGWLWYTGTHWARGDAETELYDAVVKTIEARAHIAIGAKFEKLQKFAVCSTARISACTAQLEHLFHVSPEKFGANKDLLNCANGVVNLKTGEIAPHSADQYFNYCLSVAYEPEAKSQAWLDFLADVVGHYEQVAEYLQMAVGYSLTGHTNEECLFYIHGPKRAGKGTFASTLLAVLGTPLSTTVDFSTFTAERDNDSNNFDLAGLQQTRFIVASESDRYKRLNAKRIKAITGGDEVRASYKYGDHFSYKPQYKLWLQSNWPVNADSDDSAIWGRVKVIDFPNTYYDREDKHLKDRLAEPHNLEGVLAWAVAGVMKWFASSNGLTTPEVVKAATDAHRNEQDTLAQFLEEIYEATENPEDFIPNPDFYTAYKSYCDELGVTPKQMPQLTKSLKAKGIKAGEQQKIRGQNCKGIRGLKPIIPTKEPITR